MPQVGYQTEDHEQHKFPLRLFTLALLTGILVALSLVVALPFLHAITWGVALAIMGWPMHKLIKAQVSQPSLAASISTLIVILLIVVPGMFIVYEVGQETAQMAANTEATPDQILSRQKLAEVPGANWVIDWMDRLNLDVEKEVRNLILTFLPGADGLAQSSAVVIVQFLVAMYILFYAFRDRGEFMQSLRELLPLTRDESDRVFASAADSVYANLYATIVTGLIDAVTGAILFWYLGIPAAIMWGTVMFILSILPIVGAGLVWAPVAGYLAMTGEWPSALAILIWGAITAVSVDNILYAKLAGDRMRMHPVPALISFLGGLAIFGLSGMILGPAIVAMTMALLTLWRERSKGTGSAMSDAA